MPLDDATLRALTEARIHDPFSVLGLHREGDGWWLRAWVRGAETVRAVPRDGGAAVALARRLPEGLFEGRADGRTEAFAYELEATFAGAAAAVRLRDPYSFW